MPEPQLSRLVNVREAAQILRVHAATVDRYIKRGDLPAYHIGGVTRIRLADLAEFVVGDPVIPTKSRT